MQDDDSVEQVENKISTKELKIMNSRKRVAYWVNENLRNRRLIGALDNGLFGNVNEKTHQFREVDKAKHLSKVPFLNRKFLRSAKDVRMDSMAAKRLAESRTSTVAVGKNRRSMSEARRRPTKPLQRGKNQNTIELIHPSLALDPDQRSIPTQNLPKNQNFQLFCSLFLLNFEDRKCAFWVLKCPKRHDIANI